MLAALTTSELLTRAAAEDVDRPAHYLLAAAAVNRLVTADAVMAGPAAVFIHTGMVEAGPIDLLAPLGLQDHRRLAQAGFSPEEGELVHRRGQSILRFAIRPPLGDHLKRPTRFEIAGVGVPVLSTTDLMLERLVAALEGTAADWEQAGHLAISTRLTVDWQRLRERSVELSARPGLGALPERVDVFARLAA